MEKRTRVLIKDLPSSIPSVPVFEGEDSLDIAAESSSFLNGFATALQNQDWRAFGNLFADDCWWKDSLTLTFDKRTLRGRQAIVEAWKTLSPTRKPCAFSASKDDTKDLSAQFARLSPALASLDVPFSFSTEAPKLKCLGLAKLIPKDGGWKIWILATGALSLEEHPFAPLPRQSPSMIDASQRGKTRAQGLPRVKGVLDAIVIGTSCSGLANTIMLDSLGANVAAFDLEDVAGGVWSRMRYDSLTLHHPASMMQLPQFPVPDSYPKYLSTFEVATYLASAVEALQLPVFSGIKVISNTFDEATDLWQVRIRDVETESEAILQAKNVVLSNGFLLGPNYPNLPDMSDRHLFKGPVQHTAEYRTAQPYQARTSLLLGRSVTILQRSPTPLFDFHVVSPMIEANYQGHIPVDTADFLDNVLPLAVKRDLSRGGIAMIIQSQAERYAALESKGYIIDKNPCPITKAIDEKGHSFYLDQPKTFDLVFEDRIKIARGEARGFTEGGLVVHDKTEGKDRIVEAGGVVFATGYPTVDLPKIYAESGFVDVKSASKLENACLFGSDEEGEIPGHVTFSGHPHFYFSGIGFILNRWVSLYTAIQVMADVSGKFPERYPRQS